MNHTCKFGGIPSTGSRDIMGASICHADADMDADANGIRAETNMRGHKKDVFAYIYQNA